MKGAVQFDRGFRPWVAELLKKRKGKLISFTPYRDMQDKLQKAINESGQSRSVFLADAIEEYLEKLWEPKNKKK